MARNTRIETGAKHKPGYNDRLENKALRKQLEELQGLISETDGGIQDMLAIGKLMLSFGYTDKEVMSNHTWEWYRGWLEDIFSVYIKKYKSKAKVIKTKRKELVTKNFKDFDTINSKNILFFGDGDEMMVTLGQKQEKVNLILADYMENMLACKLLNKELMAKRLKLMYDVISDNGVCLVYVPYVCYADFETLVHSVFGGVDSFPVKGKNTKKTGFGKNPDRVYFLTKYKITTKQMVRRCIMAPMVERKHTYYRTGINEFYSVLPNSFNTTQTDPLALEARCVVEWKLPREKMHMYTVIAEVIAGNNVRLKLIDDFDYEKYASGFDFENCWKVSRESYEKQGYIVYRLDFGKGENLRGCSKEYQTMKDQIVRKVVRVLNVRGEYKLVSVEKVSENFILSKIDNYLQNNTVMVGEVFEFIHDTIYNQTWEHEIEVKSTDHVGKYDRYILDENGKGATFTNRRSATMYKHILSWVVTEKPIRVLDLTAGTGNFEKALFNSQNIECSVIACESNAKTYECLKKNMMYYTNNNVVEVELIEVDDNEEYTKEVYRRNLANVILKKMNDKDVAYATSKYVAKEVKRLVDRHAKFGLYAPLSVGRKWYEDKELGKVDVNLENISKM